MVLEAPCCGGGLSGFYSLHILIFDNPQIQYFPVFPKFLNPSPQFLYIKNIRKIIQKFSKNY